MVCICAQVREPEEGDIVISRQKTLRKGTLYIGTLLNAMRFQMLYLFERMRLRELRLDRTSMKNVSSFLLISLNSYFKSTSQDTFWTTAVCLYYVMFKTGKRISSLISFLPLTRHAFARCLSQLG